VSEHRRAGLEPAGEDGTFYQRWPYRWIGTHVAGAALRLEGAGEPLELRTGENAVFSGAVEDRMDLPLTFVHGADQPPRPGSLEGRIAVFATPGEWGGALQSMVVQQTRHATASGAAGTLHLLDADVTPEELGRMAEAQARGGRIIGWELPPPRIFVHREAAAAAAPELAELVRRAESQEAFHEPIEARLTGDLPPLVVDDARPANVVAVIRGSDPALRDEYVVLSAHYDHVGVGQPMNGDSIYNGADDNASGTAVLLEVGRAIAGMDAAPRRSVLFVHVSGEEKGLLGSRWFVDHPTVPVERMVANINADMVAGDHHRDTLVVIGKEYSTLGPLVDEVNASLPELDLVTSDDLWPEQRFFFRSDQFHFMRKEIPSLFFFTGVHECYHRPCDTVEFVDHDKAARIARLLTHSVLEIANRDERPRWDPEGLEEVRRLTAGGR
jgi:hypothetical protein